MTNSETNPSDFREPTSPLAEPHAESTSMEPLADAPAGAPATIPSEETHVSENRNNKVKKTTAGSMWVGLVISAILLIVLLVFILQNQQPTELNLFAWSWTFPAGVGMLFAAILGALITALVGGWRMFELRRQIRNAGRK